MLVAEKHNTFIDIERVAKLLPVSIYWLDKDAVLIGGNNYFYALLGIDENTQAIHEFIHTKFPHEITQRIIEHEKEVIRSGQDSVLEEVTEDAITGEKKSYTVFRTPVRDSDGTIVGLVGTLIDTTSEKKAEKLRLENERIQFEKRAQELKLESERQRIALQEKESFASLARKVAHDISSPLAALKVLSERCEELPEAKRSLLRSASESILDIANNLISNYQATDILTNPQIESRQPLLVSDLLIQLLSEKKVEYQQSRVNFEIAINPNAHFAFICSQKTEFRRTISNLINNAVDALEGKEEGKIVIQLSADTDFVNVQVQDNGTGISRDKIEKILGRESFTEGKENGHGLGLQQVWSTLEHNQGNMTIQSNLGEGTSVELSFSRINAPGWIAQEIDIVSDNIVTILDDDASVHSAWEMRFKSFRHVHPKLRLHHFTQGKDVMDFFNTLNNDDKNRVLFLSDVELINQNKNGLQIIEESGIKSATLVTSHYANPAILDKADKLFIKILPKQMASVVPIIVSSC